MSKNAPAIETVLQKGTDATTTSLPSVAPPPVPEEPKKKGKISWKPAKRMELIQKTPGFTYRWCDKDPFNIQKKEADGWSIASKVRGNEANNGAPQGTSITEYRELVLMAIPDEEYAAHREYFHEKTLKQTVGLKKKLAGDVADGAATSRSSTAPIHGSIVID